MPVSTSSGKKGGIINLPLRRRHELEFVVETYNRVRNEVQGDDGFPPFKDGSTLFTSKERVAECIYIFLQYKEYAFGNQNPVQIPPPIVCNFAYLKCLAEHINKVLPWDMEDPESEFQFCVLMAPQNDPGRVLTVLYKLACIITEYENFVSYIDKGQVPNCVQQWPGESLNMKICSPSPSTFIGKFMQVLKSVFELKRKKRSENTASVEKVFKLLNLYRVILRMLVHLQTYKMTKNR